MVEWVALQKRDAARDIAKQIEDTTRHIAQKKAELEKEVAKWEEEKALIAQNQTFDKLIKINGTTRAYPKSR